MRKFLRPTSLEALILGALIGVILLVNGFKSFEDPDFFWHLKTGEWIWQNRALPAEDPFAYTTQAHPTGIPRITLTQYWISQVLLYLFHRAGGFPALIAFRLVIAGLLLLVMFRQNRGSRLIFLSLLALSAVVLGLYPLERPQAFSFICFGALFGLLTAVRRPSPGGPAGKAPVIAIPLLMVAWANLHGLFLLGQALILAFLALEGLKFLHPALRPTTREGYRRLAIAGVLGLAGSFCNPNTWHGLAFFASPAAPSWMLNVEYQSTLYLARDLHLHRIIVYWVLLLVVILGFVVCRRRLDLTALAIISGLGILSFLQNRYVPFFLVVALPGAASHLSREEIRKPAATALAALALCAGLFFSWQDRDRLLTFGSGKWVSPLMPEEQADFILANDLKGNMYNYGTWGGYLIWRLSPERKVFVDGRGLSLRDMETTAYVDYATRFQDTGAPVWKSVFKKYNIRYVVTPFSRFDGVSLPLADALLREPEWVPCANDGYAVVFVQDTAENSDVVRKCRVKYRGR